MDIYIASKLFCVKNWRAVFKDLVKFYFYLVLFYGLAIVLIWVHAHISLESSIISVDEMLSKPMTSTELNFNKFNFKDYELMANLMREAMFILVCLGVFFTSPAKNFSHIIAVTVLISLTIHPPFFYDAITKWLMDNSYLFSLIFLIWLSSIGWNKFKNRVH